jgi:hypothetical protein
MVTKECMANCLRICPLYQKMEFTTDDGEVFHLLDEGDTFSLFYNGEIGCFDWDDGSALDKAVDCLNNELTK